MNEQPGTEPEEIMDETAEEITDETAEETTDETAEETMDETGTEEAAEETPDAESNAEESAEEPEPQAPAGSREKALQDKVAALEDKVKRQMAEFDNFRKRTTKEKEQMFSMGERSVIEKMLPIVDNFERGFDTVTEEDKDDAFVDGMRKIYAQLQKQMEELRSQYQAETLRGEEEFNRKYEEFLEGQREFPKTILQKRQTELQELLDKNIQFKENSRKELEKAEQDLMAPLKIRLIETLGNIGRQNGYAFIIDTDVKALPFINPAMGIDLNQQVQDALK